MFIRKWGKSVNMDKPILLDIVLHTGYRIDGARVECDAPKIAGFLAIESPDIKHATKYISISNIASFTVLNEEVCNIIGSFNASNFKG